MPEFWLNTLFLRAAVIIRVKKADGFAVRFLTCRQLFAILLDVSISNSVSSRVAVE